MADSYNSGLHNIYYKFYKPTNIGACAYIPFYEGAADDDAKTGDDKGATDDKKGGDPKPGKTFTQEQVDKLIDTRFAKLKGTNERLVSDLEKLKTNAGLTVQEKETLQLQIDELNSSMMTKEQQATQEREKLEKKHKTTVEQLTAEASGWKNRFVDSSNKRAITDAAVAVGAEDPSQLVLMFQSSTRLEEEKGADGKLTGNFVSRVKFQGLDEENKPVALDLPVNEAFAHMKAKGLHKNLFKHGANSGTGQPAGGQGGAGNDTSKMPVRESYPTSEAFTAAYMTWREKNSF